MTSAGRRVRRPGGPAVADVAATPPYAAGYVRFPPRWRHVLVPQEGRVAAGLGVALYTAVRPKPVAAQWGLWAAARVAGARALPGPRERWSPPLEQEVFARLWAQWTRCTGGGDALAVYARTQEFRAGLVLVVCHGRRSMLVRLRRDGAELEGERALAQVAEEHPASTFRVPRVLGHGESDGWHWLGYEVMSLTPHLPTRAVPPALTDDITRLVERAVPRPAGTPAHWRGAHNDLCPWNLRRTRRGRWLIDWEDAGYAPPGADRVYFAATAAAMRGAEPTGPLALEPSLEEARAFWAQRVAQRRVTDQEEQLQRRLTVLLGARG